MRTKRGAGVAALLASLLLVAPVAWAADQASGGGQTKRSATLGFVAKSDRTGELTYQSNNGSFWVHCKRFSSFDSSETKHGYPKVEVTARKCFRHNGTQRFLRAVLVDRGEPGIAWDIARIWWSRAWPVTPQNAVRRDVGRLGAGNIQIL